MEIIDDLHPTTAVARSTDPETSWEATIKVTNIRESQAKIWSILAKVGAMIDEGILEAMIKRGWLISPSGCRTRRYELCELGLVEHNKLKNGEKDYSKTVMGNRSRVWRALDLDEWKRRQLEKFVTKEMF